MAPLKVALNLKNISVKEKQRKNSLLMSSIMIGDYTLEPLAYGSHHRGARLVELFEAPSSEYVGKNRSHGTGLINL